MITIPLRPKSGRNHLATVRVALLMALAVMTMWSMYANGQEDCELVLQGNIVPAVSISISPGLIEWNEMYPGENTIENAVAVTMFSNVNYKATIGCTVPHLKGPGPVDLLANPLEWKCGGGDFEIICVQPATIRTGGPTSNDGDTELISFRQVVEYSDPPLDNPNTPYEIKVKFAIETVL